MNNLNRSGGSRTHYLSIMSGVLLPVKLPTLIGGHSNGYDLFRLVAYAVMPRLGIYHKLLVLSHLLACASPQFIDCVNGSYLLKPI